MRYLLALLCLLFSSSSPSQVGSTASTCIWSGSLADCLPSTGIQLLNNRVVRFGELTSNGANYVALTAPTSLAGDRTATFPDATGNVVIDSATQTLTNKTISGASNTITNVSLTAGVTGVLPLANGGTNKNATAVNGGLVWSDADSMEITSAGTASQWVLSGGAATPTMTNTTTTGKFIDGSADEIQLTVQGHSTQTNGLLVVENSGGTNLLEVTLTNGTQIVGTTTNDNATLGHVGQLLESVVASASSVALTTATRTDMTSLSLTAGDWDVTILMTIRLVGNSTMTVVSTGIGTASGTSTTGLVDGNNVTELAGTWTSGADTVVVVPAFRVSLAGTTTYYAKIRCVFVVGTGSVSAFGRLSARRVR